METLNQKDDGYRGIWYMNQPSHDEYVYKYSGGLGTYCAKHQPFAVYAPQVRRTYFCYGGSTPQDCQQLLHMVSYYDHASGQVTRPTVLLDKQTDDAHDNPVISIDAEGHIWVFSTSHGTGRPSYIHRSDRPFDIGRFTRVPATRLVDGQHQDFDNFSYMQVSYVQGHGFAAFLTHYNDPSKRTLFYLNSADGVAWSEWVRLAAIQEGHYQISATSGQVSGSAFNYHPDAFQPGLNWRTNLYYMETDDRGQTWRTAGGAELGLPLTEVHNAALVHDYEAEGLKVYLKDILFDPEGHPVIVHVVSKGYEAGPENGPRVWKTARWTGSEWDIAGQIASDSNYDTGSLFIEPDGNWLLIAPTDPGPQPYNPGGEVVMWTSPDQGHTWTRAAQLTRDSERNHTYVRRPVNAHPDFCGFWADGHARQPSISRLYFCNREGQVRILPANMPSDYAVPEAL
jgi:hypothetical protein